ncbi:MAG: hypothetical protein WCA37_10545 [Terracidiphilus sp.]
MKPLLQLNLHDEREKAEVLNPPQPETKEQHATTTEKRLNRIAAKAAHRAATEYRRSSSSIFSK